MRTTLWVSTVFLIVVFVPFRCTATYGPWDSIKSWYVSFPYDSDGAEKTQEEFEKQCAEKANETSGVCFDECMLRENYWLLIADDSVTVCVERVMYVAMDVLKIDASPQAESIADAIQVRLSRCSDHVVASFGDRACVDLDPEHKKKLQELTDCVKDMLKKPVNRDYSMLNLKIPFSGCCVW